MIQATASQLMKQFAENLKKQLAASQLAPAAATSTQTAAAPTTQSPAPQPPPAAKPISGFSLMARVIRDAVVRLFTGRST
jgi:hypothetical protein